MAGGLLGGLADARGSLRWTLGSLPYTRCIVSMHCFLEPGDGLLDRGLHIGRHTAFRILERLFGGVDVHVRLIASLHNLLASFVFVRMGFRLPHQTLDLGLVPMLECGSSVPCRSLYL